jgi:hypothetical protein
MEAGATREFPSDFDWKELLGVTKPARLGRKVAWIFTIFQQ